MVKGDPATQTVPLLVGLEKLTVQGVPLAFEAQGQLLETRKLGLSLATVGSGPDCHWVVSGEGISRKHCELSLAPEGVRVRDLGSKNGTWCQGLKITEAIVPLGGSFTVGAVTVRVLFPTDTLELPLSRNAAFGEAVGTSPAMRALFAKLERLASTDHSTLLLGESGTGKELLAHGIHLNSPRKERPFVVFDCGATAPTLVESDLFGHVKGAYTGANAARTGLFEDADGGTLFLDEIGDLPLDTQTRLLRALETGRFRPVGSSEERSSNVRVIAATSRNLEARVAAKQFREDLYFRLAVVVAEVPPLRERKEDIPLLIERLMARRSPPVPFNVFPSSVLPMLQAHSWPGNVRELANTVTRLLLFPAAGAKVLETRLTSTEVLAGHGSEYYALPLKEARAAVVSDFELDYLRAKLRENQNNVTQTAKAIGVSRQFLHRLLDEYGVGANEDE